MSIGRVALRAGSVLMVGWLSFLFGCGPKDARSGPFELRDGVWHFESTPIADADAKTFQAAGGRYARDARRVYYGSTYRDGRDYFTTRRSRVVVVEGADPASFSVLGSEYARDRAGGSSKASRSPREPRPRRSPCSRPATPPTPARCTSRESC